MGKFKPFFQDGNRVVCYKGDCLEVMPELDGPVDMILADLPYGQVACKWDVVIPFEPLWDCYKRLIKPEGAVVLFGSQPFTTDLICSNRKWFKYCWVWNKKLVSNPFLSKNSPLRILEDICIFSQKSHRYYPQMKKGGMRSKGGGATLLWNKQHEKASKSDLYHPTQLLDFSNTDRSKTVHPTQKPVDLLSYLIRTYTQPNDLILDNTAGSFSTGVAAILNGRRFIGIEQEDKYCKIGQQRIEKALQEVDSMLIKPWEIEAQPQPEHEQGDLFEAV